MQLVVNMKFMHINLIYLYAEKLKILIHYERHTLGNKVKP